MAGNDLDLDDMMNNNDNFNNEDNQNNNSPAGPSVWIFGYGSLCWYPGFEYDKCITGYVRGYVRRFWQGNTTHRGTHEKVSNKRAPFDPEEPVPSAVSVVDRVGDTASFVVG